MAQTLDPNTLAIDACRGRHVATHRALCPTGSESWRPNLSPIGGSVGLNSGQTPCLGRRRGVEKRIMQVYHTGDRLSKLFVWVIRAIAFSARRWYGRAVARDALVPRYGP